MPEIGFYHLTRTDEAAALPALLGRTLAAGEHALVLCAPARLARLDEALWLSQSPDWLPHGTAATPHPEWQPIFLSDTETNPAGAKFLFLLDGVESADLAAYSRVFDLFDGNSEAALAAARRRWKAAKQAGHAATYWQQTDTGWKKATA